MRIFRAYPSNSFLKKRQFLKCFAILIGITCILWIVRDPVLHMLERIILSEYGPWIKFCRIYAPKNQKGPFFITLADHGRLGNWLYAYASLLGIAKINGYIPYLKGSHPIRYIFQISKIRSSHAMCLLSIPDPLPQGYVRQFNNLPAANISIDGYIQSWKYFYFMEDEIRKEFTFTDDLQYQIKLKFSHYFSKYLKEGRVVISIHVRWGDILKAGAQSIGFRPAPLAYFKNAMNYMARKFPFSVFLVVSDDIEWCKDNIRPVSVEYYNKENRYVDGNFRIVGESEVIPLDVDEVKKVSPMKENIPVVFSDSDSSEVDLGLLTMANHSIISVGTFGWWGAWLANGHVVYYKDHIIPGTLVHSKTVDEDFFPPYWVPLS